MVSVTTPDQAPAAGETAILAAATQVFSREGYHGASIREIAKSAGMSSASLYHHFGSKQGLLFRIVEKGMDELLDRTREAVEAVGDDPEARLRAVVAVHVRIHAIRRERALLTTREMRNLKPAQRRTMREKFRQQQRFFDQAVLDGVEKGVFHTDRPLEAARAIASMCTAVAGWFKPKGGLSPDEVADMYTDFAVALVRGGGRCEEDRA
jgi:AcrR family transcriptional regulator